MARRQNLQSEKSSQHPHFVNVTNLQQSTDKSLTNHTYTPTNTPSSPPQKPPHTSNPTVLHDTPPAPR